MRTTVEAINSYSKKLKIELSKEDLLPVEQKVLKKYQKSANIRGFRKGHAPLNMVKKQFQTSIQIDTMEEAEHGKETIPDFNSN